MAKRARSLGIILASSAVTLVTASALSAQLYQGPAQGTSAPGQLTTTASFPPAPPAYPEVSPRPPRHRIELFPDPPGLRPPLAPVGANEQEDVGWLLPAAPGSAGPALLRRFAGVLQTPSIPPDPIVAAGPNHLMALVNRDFAILSKDGVNLQQIFAPGWFSNVQPTNNAFDPKVIYDHSADRWVMVWLAVDSSTSHILVSVSDDADPQGNWCNWAFRGDFNGGTKVDDWSDYQGVGFDESAVYVVPNQFTFAGGFAYAKLRILPKATLYDTACPAVTYTDLWDLRDPDTGNKVFTVRPAVTFGAPGVEYLISDSPFFTGTFMTLWSLTNPLDPNPTLTAVNVPVTQRQPPPDADQLEGSSMLVDVGGPRVRNLVYRDGSVWTAHSVADVSGNYARARYVRIDVASPVVLEDVSFGRDGCWLYYPAITADVSSNMVMVYNQSCTDEYIGIRYTGRRPADTGLQPSELLKAGEANYVKDFGTGRNRWGDYNGIAVDPADPTRVWTFAEYASSPANTWGTWVGEIAAARLTGDVNDDGGIDVGDVVLLVDIILERVTPDPVTAFVSDCNRDVGLDVGDVVCLVGLILGSGQPALAASRAPATAGASVARARLQIEPAKGDGAERTVLLEAELPRDAAGLQARIAYDPGRVRPGLPELAERASGFELAVQDKGDELLLLVYDLGGGTLSGTGPLVRIPVRTLPGAAAAGELDLELEQVLVAGKGSAVRSVEIVRAELVALPAEFRLSNPYPNPLARGSGTKLDLEIPETAGPAFSGQAGEGRAGPVHVVAGVYNVRGQRVRRLIDADLVAGRHTLEWDGRNDRGELVGAGLYVLRLRAGAFVGTRKLIVPGR